jgi:hypothetical protein
MAPSFSFHFFFFYFFQAYHSWYIRLSLLWFNSFSKVQILSLLQFSEKDLKREINKNRNRKKQTAAIVAVSSLELASGHGSLFFNPSLAKSNPAAYLV